jgi:hypothetical protein
VDFAAEIYPQDYLRIFLLFSFQRGHFLRILPPQENPQVTLTLTFAEAFAADCFGNLSCGFSC